MRIKCLFRFTINIENEEEIAFHFDVRHDYGGTNEVIVRNTKTDCGWGGEERDCHFPFGKNRFFEMLILVEPQGFKVN